MAERELEGQKVFLLSLTPREAGQLVLLSFIALAVMKQDAERVSKGMLAFSVLAAEDDKLPDKLTAVGKWTENHLPNMLKDKHGGFKQTWWKQQEDRKEQGPMRKVESDSWWGHGQEEAPKPQENS